MRLVGWLGLLLMGGGAVLRQSYYSEAVTLWMNEAYQQGARTIGSGAPMNYFHQDWPVPQSVAVLGWIGLACLFFGAVLVSIALGKAKW